MTVVSVIITTLNEGLNIEKCLLSVNEQSHTDIQIIVVDNFSTDNTREIAKNFTNEIYQIGPERSAQRNFGALNKAKGEYLLYLDADMIITNNLIDTCISEIALDAECVALHIPELILGHSLFSKVRRFEREFYNGTVIDGARFIKADAFRAIGGFDSDLFKRGSGEDWDLDKSLKKIGKINLLDKKTDKVNLSAILIQNLNGLVDLKKVKGFTGIFHNESKLTFKNYIFKKRYYALGFDGYKKKWGYSDPDIKKQFSFYYRFIGVFLENTKYRKLVKRLDLYILFFIYKAIIGASYLFFRKNKN